MALRRSPMPPRRPKPSSRPRATGPSAAVLALVARRDEHACVRCGGACRGQRGFDFSYQHRRARGAGGSRREDTNQPQNLILACGSATTGCHGWMEHHPRAAREHGWAIGQHEDPLWVPVRHWRRGLIFLRADGTWSAQPPADETGEAA